MNSDELALIVVLGLSNIALGLGAGIYLSRNLAGMPESRVQRGSALALLLGMYFLECVAFAAGMATQVFSVGLAFIWGVVLGRLLRRQAPQPSLQNALQVAIYTCLPTITFAVLVSVAWALSGNSLLSAESAYSFGIPEWVPWPLGSVAGFAAALVMGTVLMKSVITVGEVSMVLHLEDKTELSTGGA